MLDVMDFIGDSWITYKEDPSPSDVQRNEATRNRTKVRLVWSVSYCIKRQDLITYPIGNSQSIESHKPSTLALEEHVTDLEEVSQEFTTWYTKIQDGLTVAALIANAALDPTPTNTRDVIAPP
jgi:hypothetical protein